MPHERTRWISLIKQIRQDHNVGILEAERIAVAQPEWRRWVERQINSDLKCRKTARSHMRLRGLESLIYEDGETLKLR